MTFKMIAVTCVLYSYLEITSNALTPQTVLIASDPSEGIGESPLQDLETSFSPPAMSNTFLIATQHLSSTPSQAEDYVIDSTIDMVQTVLTHSPTQRYLTVPTNNHITESRIHQSQISSVLHNHNRTDGNTNPVTDATSTVVKNVLVPSLSQNYNTSVNIREYDSKIDSSEISSVSNVQIRSDDKEQITFQSFTSIDHQLYIKDINLSVKRYLENKYHNGEETSDHTSDQISDHNRDHTRDHISDHISDQTGNQISDHTRDHTSDHISDQTGDLEQQLETSVSEDFSIDTKPEALKSEYFENGHQMTERVGYVSNSVLPSVKVSLSVQPSTFIPGSVMTTKYATNDILSTENVSKSGPSSGHVPVSVTNDMLSTEHVTNSLLSTKYVSKSDSSTKHVSRSVVSTKHVPKYVRSMFDRASMFRSGRFWVKNKDYQPTLTSMKTPPERSSETSGETVLSDDYSSSGTTISVSNKNKISTGNSKIKNGRPEMVYSSYVAMPSVVNYQPVYLSPYSVDYQKHSVLNTVSENTQGFIVLQSSVSSIDSPAFTISSTASLPEASVVWPNPDKSDDVWMMRLDKNYLDNDSNTPRTTYSVSQAERPSIEAFFSDRFRNVHYANVVQNGKDPSEDVNDMTELSSKESFSHTNARTTNERSFVEEKADVLNRRPSLTTKANNQLVDDVVSGNSDVQAEIIQYETTSPFNEVDHTSLVITTYGDEFDDVKTTIPPHAIVVDRSTATTAHTVNGDDVTRTPKYDIPVDDASTGTAANDVEVDVKTTANYGAETNLPTVDHVRENKAVYGVNISETLSGIDDAVNIYGVTTETTGHGAEPDMTTSKQAPYTVDVDEMTRGVDVVEAIIRQPAAYGVEVGDLKTGTPLHGVEVDDVTTGTSLYGVEVDDVTTGTSLHGVEVDDVTTGTPLHRVEVDDVTTGTTSRDFEVDDVTTGTPSRGFEVDDLTTGTKSRGFEDDVTTETTSRGVGIDGVTTGTTSRSFEVDDVTTRTPLHGVEVDGITSGTPSHDFDVDDVTRTALLGGGKDYTTAGTAITGIEADDLMSELSHLVQEDDVTLRTQLRGFEVDDVTSGTAPRGVELDDVTTGTAPRGVELDDVTRTPQHGVEVNDVTTGTYSRIDKVTNGIVATTEAALAATSLNPVLFKTTGKSVEPFKTSFSITGAINEKKDTSTPTHLEAPGTLEHSFQMENITSDTAQLETRSGYTERNVQANVKWSGTEVRGDENEGTASRTLLHGAGVDDSRTHTPAHGIYEDGMSTRTSAHDVELDHLKGSEEHGDVDAETTSTTENGVGVVGITGISTHGVGVVGITGISTHGVGVDGVMTNTLPHGDDSDRETTRTLTLELDVDDVKTGTTMRGDEVNDVTTGTVPNAVEIDDVTIATTARDVEIHDEASGTKTERFSVDDNPSFFTDEPLDVKSSENLNHQIKNVDKVSHPMPKFMFLKSVQPHETDISDSPTTDSILMSIANIKRVTEFNRRVREYLNSMRRLLRNDTVHDSAKHDLKVSSTAKGDILSQTEGKQYDGQSASPEVKAVTPATYSSSRLFDSSTLDNVQTSTTVAHDSVESKISDGSKYESHPNAHDSELRSTFIDHYVVNETQTRSETPFLVPDDANLHTTVQDDQVPLFSARNGKYAVDGEHDVTGLNHVNLYFTDYPDNTDPSFTNSVTSEIPKFRFSHKTKKNTISGDDALDTSFVDIISQIPASMVTPAIFPEELSATSKATTSEHVDVSLGMDLLKNLLYEHSLDKAAQRLKISDVSDNNRLVSGTIHRYSNTQESTMSPQWLPDTTSSQWLSDDTTSSQWLSDETTSSQWLQDDTTSPQWLPDTTSSQWLSDDTTSSQWLSDETTSSQWLQDDTTSTQWLPDETTSSQWLSDKTTSSQWLPDETTSSQWLPDETTSSQWLSIDTTSSQWLPDETTSSQWLPDETTSSQWLPDETTSSQWLPDKTTSSQLLPDETTSSQLLPDETTSSQWLPDETTSSQWLLDKTTSSQWFSNESHNPSKELNEIYKSLTWLQDSSVKPVSKDFNDILTTSKTKPKFSFLQSLAITTDSNRRYRTSKNENVSISDNMDMQKDSETLKWTSLSTSAFKKEPTRPLLPLLTITTDSSRRYWTLSKQNVGVDDKIHIKKETERYEHTPSPTTHRRRDIGDTLDYPIPGEEPLTSVPKSTDMNPKLDFNDFLLLFTFDSEGKDILSRDLREQIKRGLQVSYRIGLKKRYRVGNIRIRKRSAVNISVKLVDAIIKKGNVVEQHFQVEENGARVPADDASITFGELSPDELSLVTSVKVLQQVTSVKKVPFIHMSSLRFKTSKLSGRKAPKSVLKIQSTFLTTPESTSTSESTTTSESGSSATSMAKATSISTDDNLQNADHIRTFKAFTDVDLRFLNDIKTSSLKVSHSLAGVHTVTKSNGNSQTTTENLYLSIDPTVVLGVSPISSFAESSPSQEISVKDSHTDSSFVSGVSTVDSRHVSDSSISLSTEAYPLDVPASTDSDLVTEVSMASSTELLPAEAHPAGFLASVDSMFVSDVSTSSSTEMPPSLTHPLNVSSSTDPTFESVLSFTSSSTVSVPTEAQPLRVSLSTDPTLLSDVSDISLFKNVPSSADSLNVSSSITPTLVSVVSNISSTRIISSQTHSLDVSTSQPAVHVTNSEDLSAESSSVETTILLESEPIAQSVTPSVSDTSQHETVTVVSVSVPSNAYTDFNDLDYVNTQPAKTTTGNSVSNSADLFTTSLGYGLSVEYLTLLNPHDKSIVNLNPQVILHSSYGSINLETSHSSDLPVSSDVSEIIYPSDNYHQTTLLNFNIPLKSEIQSIHSLLTDSDKTPISNDFEIRDLGYTDSLSMEMRTSEYIDSLPVISDDKHVISTTIDTTASFSGVGSTIVLFDAISPSKGIETSMTDTQNVFINHMAAIDGPTLTSSRYFSKNSSEFESGYVVNRPTISPSVTSYVSSVEKPTTISAFTSSVLSMPKPTITSSITSSVLSMPKPTITSSLTSSVLSMPKPTITSSLTSSVLSMPKPTITSSLTSSVLSMPKPTITSSLTSSVLSMPKPTITSSLTSSVLSMPKPTITSSLTSSVLSMPKPTITSSLTSSVSSGLKPTMAPSLTSDDVEQENTTDTQSDQLIKVVASDSSSKYVEDVVSGENILESRLLKNVVSTNMPVLDESSLLTTSDTRVVFTVDGVSLLDSLQTSSSPVLDESSLLTTSDTRVIFTVDGVSLLDSLQTRSFETGSISPLNTFPTTLQQEDELDPSSETRPASSVLDDVILYSSSGGYTVYSTNTDKHSDSTSYSTPFVSIGLNTAISKADIDNLDWSLNSNTDQSQPSMNRRSSAYVHILPTLAKANIETLRLSSMESHKESDSNPISISSTPSIADDVMLTLESTRNIVHSRYSSPTVNILTSYDYTTLKTDVRALEVETTAIDGYSEDAISMSSSTDEQSQGITLTTLNKLESKHSSYSSQSTPNKWTSYRTQTRNKYHSSTSRISSTVSLSYVNTRTQSTNGHSYTKLRSPSTNGPSYTTSIIPTTGPRYIEQATPSTKRHSNTILQTLSTKSAVYTTLRTANRERIPSKSPSYTRLRTPLTQRPYTTNKPTHTPPTTSLATSSVTMTSSSTLSHGYPWLSSSTSSPAESPEMKNKPPTLRELMQIVLKMTQREDIKGVYFIRRLERGLARLYKQAAANSIADTDHSPPLAWNALGGSEFRVMIVNSTRLSDDRVRVVFVMYQSDKMLRCDVTLPVFESMSATEISADLGYPVLGPVRGIQTSGVTTTTNRTKEVGDVVLIVAVVFPTVCLLLVIAFLVIRHCRCRPRPNVVGILPSRYQVGETLDENNLAVDVEKGEIVDKTPMNTPALHRAYSEKKLALTGGVFSFDSIDKKNLHCHMSEPMSQVIYGQQYSPVMTCGHESNSDQSHNEMVLKERVLLEKLGVIEEKPSKHEVNPSPGYKNKTPKSRKRQRVVCKVKNSPEPKYQTVDSRCELLCSSDTSATMTSIDSGDHTDASDEFTVIIPTSRTTKIKIVSNDVSVSSSKGSLLTIGSVSPSVVSSTRTTDTQTSRASSSLSESSAEDGNCGRCTHSSIQKMSSCGNITKVTCNADVREFERDDTLADFKSSRCKTGSRREDKMNRMTMTNGFNETGMKTRDSLQRSAKVRVTNGFNQNGLNTRQSLKTTAKASVNDPKNIPFVSKLLRINADVKEEKPVTSPPVKFRTIDYFVFDELEDEDSSAEEPDESESTSSCSNEDMEAEAESVHLGRNMRAQEPDKNQKMLERKQEKVEEMEKQRRAFESRCQEGKKVQVLLNEVLKADKPELNAETALTQFSQSLVQEQIQSMGIQQ